MDESIYTYRDYKEFIYDRVENSANALRGTRKRLAEAMNCQVSHITNVLNANSHFSAEQLERGAHFFNLDEGETRFLLLLAQYNRAGTSTLRELYKKELDRQIIENSKIKKRIQIENEVRREDELEHYSSWQYGAVHVLLSIPGFQTRQAIAKKLKLPISRVDEILSLLIRCKMAQKKGTTYNVLSREAHLSRDSNLVAKHNANWRIRTLSELQDIKDESLHFSGALSLSEETFIDVREILTRSISQLTKKVQKSDVEIPAAICMDFYKL